MLNRLEKLALVGMFVGTIGLGVGYIIDNNNVENLGATTFLASYIINRRQESSLISLGYKILRKNNKDYQQ